jgi:hypothetical protein
MSKWLMRGHFGHLHFKTFSNGIKNTSRRGVLPSVSSSEVAGIPEDSQFPLFGSVSFIFTLASKWGCDRPRNFQSQVKFILGINSCYATFAIVKYAPTCIFVEKWPTIGGF